MTATADPRQAVIKPALAKINLYLHLTGRRANGYHELDSLVAFADVGDRITATRANDLTLSVSGPYGDTIGGDADDNLVIKAARTLADHAGVPAQAHLHLEKNLPVASGIGGGSADAAATLKALVALWNLELPDEHIRHAAQQISDEKDTARALETLFKLWRDDLNSDLMLTVALQLGADVPVCLEGHAAYMGGIGEKLDLAPHLPPAWLVLVNPGTAVSTPAVFQARSGDLSQPARFYESPRDAAHLAHLLKDRRNDLTQAALSLAPVIAEVLAALETQDDALLTRMSGSGATCFALFATPDAARVATNRVRAMHPGWWTIAAKMIDSPLAL